jgi:mRNA interferase MazF
VRSGDVLTVDFGVPIGSTPALIRPAIVVSADRMLAVYTHTLHVVPVTTNVTNARSTELAVSGDAVDRPSVAQCQLCTVIDSAQIVAETGRNVGAVQLAQLRSILSDLLDID